MTFKTVFIKGSGVRKEAIAGGTITPGDLLAVTSTGTVTRQGTAAVNVLPRFALENEVVGGDIDTDYAAADTVLFGVYSPGAEIYTNIAASAAAIVIGDFLEADASGGVRKVTTAAATADVARHSIVGRALEAVNNSGGGTRVRLLIEVA